MYKRYKAYVSKRSGRMIIEVRVTHTKSYYTYYYFWLDTPKKYIPVYSIPAPKHNPHFTFISKHRTLKDIKNTYVEYLI